MKSQVKKLMVEGGIIMANMEIRNEIKAARVPHWAVAEAMEMHPSAFSVMLRHELPMELAQEVRAAIQAAKQEMR